MTPIPDLPRCHYCGGEGCVPTVPASESEAALLVPCPICDGITSAS